MAGDVLASGAAGDGRQLGGAGTGSGFCPGAVLLPGAWEASSCGSCHPAWARPSPCPSNAGKQNPESAGWKRALVLT